MADKQEWTVSLSSEIYSDWREQISTGVAKAGLPVTVTSPVTDHASSEDCGFVNLGGEDKAFWKDNKGAHQRNPHADLDRPSRRQRSLW